MGSTLPTFVAIAGYVIGLGAVTVVDLHGFLGRRSSYWTEATTRTHRVTKPLIWIGTALAAAGWFGLLYGSPLVGLPLVVAIVGMSLVLNGCFLTFGVSPFLLERERRGRAAELLPARWQRWITASFLVSAAGWWGSLALLATFLADR